MAFSPDCNPVTGAGLPIIAALAVENVPALLDIMVHARRAVANRTPRIMRPTLCFVIKGARFHLRAKRKIFLQAKDEGYLQGAVVCCVLQSKSEKMDEDDLSHARKLMARS